MNSNHLAHDHVETISPVAPSVGARAAWLILLFGVFGQAVAGAAEAYRITTGPHAVAATIESFTPAKSQRPVPAVIYYPRTNASDSSNADATSTRFPLVILSTTIGSADETYAELARYWASHGYVVAAVLHPETSESALREPKSGTGKKAPPGPSGTTALIRKAQEPQHWRQRTIDVLAVLDGVNESKILRERVDLSRIAIAGHTIGAHTALCLIGQRTDMGQSENVSLSDERFDVAIAISPPPVGMYGTDPEAFQDVVKPCLHVYGGIDIARSLKQAENMPPYDRIKAGEQFLMTIEGADARAFTRQAPALNTLRREDSNNQEDWIRMTTLAFLDAYLKGESEGKTWLHGGDIEQLGLGRVTLDSK